MFFFSHYFANSDLRTVDVVVWRAGVDAFSSDTDILHRAPVVQPIDPGRPAAAAVVVVSI